MSCPFGHKEPEKELQVAQRNFSGSLCPKGIEEDEILQADCKFPPMSAKFLDNSCNRL